MNSRQRILTYAAAAVFVFTLYFVPWRVQNNMGGYYEFSPYWRPVIYDEGGVLRPVIAYAEWGVLTVTYISQCYCLRTKRKKP